MRKLILMLVVLLSSFANGQYSHGGEDYTIVSGDTAFTNDVNGLADGSFSWSWTQPVSDISATQIFFDPAGNPAHRSDYVVSLTRNGQSGDVTVTVTSTTSVGQYRWGTATAPTSSVDHSDINRAIADARASLSVGESAYIWTTATTSYHATLGQTQLLVRAPDGNGGNVIGGSANPTRGQQIQYDEPDFWGPWTYSHPQINDDSWETANGADFGPNAGLMVAVTRTRTRENRGTVRETLVGTGFEEFRFANTNPGAFAVPVALMGIYDAFIATETINVSEFGIFIRDISIDTGFNPIDPQNQLFEVYHGDGSIELFGVTQDQVIAAIRCYITEIDAGRTPSIQAVSDICE